MPAPVPLIQPVVLPTTAGVQQCTVCGARATSVCSAIDDEHLTRLAAIAVTTEAEPGKAFIEEGEAADSFFNITAGTVILFKLLPDGRRQITGFAGAGHFLGLAASDSYAFSAEAIDKVRYCRFSRRRLRKLLDDFPAMETRLLELATNELVAAQKQMLLLGRKTALERLASFLVARSRLGGPRGPRRTRISLPMTRSDIADYLGLTIETVSRAMTKLRADKLIELPGPQDVVLRDLAKLERLAGALT
jgi:CRP/FNR family transcriptional regulator, anaerobic regulatory protein